MIAVKGAVTGRVQGVGFRFFTREQALALGLVGYVQNMDDGSVFFFAQGEQEAIDQFCRKLQSGPRFSRVDQCDVDAAAVDDKLEGFSVRY